MDMDQVRTFLEVVETGSFIRAAEALHVTQSTVSARVKELELQLKQPLFVRRKSGVTLTPAGKRFQPHAQTMLHVLRQARQDVALPAELRAVLNVGGQYSLWQRILLAWVADYRIARPEVAVRAEVGTPDSLMNHLADGLLDFVVMYSPEARPGFQIEKLMDETLIMVATRPDHKGPGDADYVFVDWGRDFAAWHSDQFPDFGAPGLHVSLGALGLNYVQTRGGAGYFPRRVVAEDVATKKLYRVAGVPEFLRPAHVIFPADSGNEVAVQALDSLRAMIAKDASRPALKSATSPARGRAPSKSKSA
ncbi:MAG: LysR family transcriptional regulator [Rhodospirillaceae bacterium]|nr:LysR family transcriptional regulator [Rhodospirillaceae bacterium]